MAKSKTLTVQFTGVSFGKETAKIGVQVSRDKIDLQTADEILTSARLSCKLSHSDATLPMEGGLENLESVADCRGLNVKADHISFGLSMNMEGMDTNALVGFRNKEAKLVVRRVGDCGPQASTDDEPVEEEVDDGE